jgi:hypothetical protein
MAAVWSDARTYVCTNHTNRTSVQVRFPVLSARLSRAVVSHLVLNDMGSNLRDAC